MLRAHPGIFSFSTGLCVFSQSTVVAGQTLDISSIFSTLSNSGGLTVSPLGDKVFVTTTESLSSGAAREVYQYNLGVANDLTTAGAPILWDTGLTDGGGTRLVQDISFSPNGLILYLPNNTTFGRIHAYTVSSPFDLTVPPVLIPGFYDLGVAELPITAHISNDGNRFYTITRQGGSNRLIQLGLLSPFVINGSSLATAVVSMDTLLGPGVSVESIYIDDAEELCYIYYDIDGLSETFIEEVVFGTPGDASTLAVQSPRVIIDVTAQDDSARGLSFTQAKQFFYTFGDQNETIIQYTNPCAPPPPIGICLVPGQALSHISDGHIAMNPTGTRVFVGAEIFPSDIETYELSVPFDLTSAGPPILFEPDSLPGGILFGNIRGIDFNATGTRAFITFNGISNRVFGHIDMSTPYDFSTATATVPFIDTDVIGGVITTQPSEGRISPTGDRFYYIENGTSRLRTFAVPTPFDISILTEIPGEEINLNTIIGSGSLASFWLSDDGITLYVYMQITTVAAVSADTVWKLTLSTPFDMSTAVLDTNETTITPAPTGTPVSIILDPSLEHLYVTNNDTDTITRYNTLGNCPP